MAFGVLRCIADHPASQLHELLPWHWKLRNPRRCCLTTLHHGLGRMATADMREKASLPEITPKLGTTAD
jgi:hypothetical protein